MAKLSSETVSAIAAILASLFAAYSGWEARQTRFTTHQDAIESLQQTQRAYIGVQLSPGKNSLWTAELKTTGASPALNVNVAMYSDAIDSATSVAKISEKAAEDMKALSEQRVEGKILNALFLPGTSQQLFAESAPNSKPQTIAIYFGTITYSDVFRHSHTTHYCIFHGNFCETGNDAD